MHFCMDEAMAILAALPSLALGVAWLRGKLHHQKKHGCCK